MKHTLIAGLMAILFAAAPAAASVKYFDFTFAPKSNFLASAYGTIGFGMDVISAAQPTTRFVYDPYYKDYATQYYATSLDFVRYLSVTVQNSTDPSANNTFTLTSTDPMIGVLFDVSLLGVNFNTPLFAQQTYNDGSTWWNWGTWDKAGPTNVGGGVDQSRTGDFQLFSGDSSFAPYGIDPYQMSSGNGEEMQLTSFGPAAVPEPSTYALLCIGLGVVGFVRRKMVTRG